MFYQYNTQTYKYVAEVQEARYNVMTGELVDGYTDKIPPAVPDGQELYFENGDWVLKDIDYDALLTENKNKKLNLLKTLFEDKCNTGIMNSATLNKEVNARRGIDLTNVQGLIDLLNNNGESSVQFRCADNTFTTVTLDQLNSLKLEMIEYGQSLYQKKWDYETQINNATTQDDLDSIVISFD